MSEVNFTRQQADEIFKIIDKANLCGCGTDAAWAIVLKLLEMAEDHDKKGSFYGVEGDPTQPWIEFGAKILDSWGLTEHGTGIGWAWLTDKGKLLLRFLREFGLEDYNHCESEQEKPHWPKWATCNEAYRAGNVRVDIYGEWAESRKET